MKGRARWAIATCGATLAVAGPVAFAAALQPRPSPVLISATAAGAAANGVSGTFGLAISGDGRSVAFASMATDLAAADADPTPDVYVRDVADATTILASANVAGERGNDMSERPSLSADGSRVAFLSLASNLEDPPAPDRNVDAFVKDLASHVTRVVSTSDGGAKANGATSAVTLSGDGDTVAFVSTATNLDSCDSDSLPDLYVKNLSTGALTLASVTADGKKGMPGPFGIATPSLSADGTRVAFSTDAPLSDADHNNVADVYVKDLKSGQLELASVGGDGAADNGPSVDPMLSADGSHVVFASSASSLDPRDPDTISDVYVADLAAGRVTLASTSGAGQKADRGATDPAISHDGRYVAFLSDATNLGLDSVLAGQLELYWKDLESGDVVPISVAADGSPVNALSLYPALSADGSKIAFATPATNLSAHDTNGLADVYLVAGRRAGAIADGPSRP